jgi:ketosteroid isomerase-like protein
MTRFVSAILVLVFASLSVAQQTEPADKELIVKQIMQLENAEVKAVLEADTLTLKDLWAEDVHVNNPSNSVVDRSQVFERFRSTFIEYSLYAREQEYFGVYDDVVVVMGSETVVPSGDNPEKGKTLKRRYTSVYKKFDAGWKLIARHANVIE